MAIKYVVRRKKLMWIIALNLCLATNNYTIKRTPTVDGWQNIENMFCITTTKDDCIPCWASYIILTPSSYKLSIKKIFNTSVTTMINRQTKAITILFWRLISWLSFLWSYYILLDDMYPFLYINVLFLNLLVIIIKEKFNKF